MKLANCLVFTAHCGPAFDFYTQCGLGRVVELMRYGDAGMPVRDV